MILLRPSESDRRFAIPPRDAILSMTFVESERCSHAVRPESTAESMALMAGT